MSASFGSAILLSLSTIMGLILILIILFNVSQSVREEIRDIGVRSALGWHTTQIRTGYLVLYLGLTLVAFALGLALAAALLPAIQALFEAQSGYHWLRSFSGPACALTAALILGVTALNVLVATRSVRAYTPVEALNGGRPSRSFKPNHFPLEHQCAPLTLLLALKDLTQQLRSNLLVLMVAAGVMFAGVFALFMYNGIVLRQDDFIDLAAGETADLVVSLKPTADLAEARDAIRQTPGVAKLCDYGYEEALLENLNTEISVSDDFALYDTNMVYEGRYPELPTEIAVNGRLASRLGFRPGDEVTLTAYGRSLPYLVTGLMQSGNGGNDSLLTTAAFQRLNPGYSVPSILVYLTPDASPAAVIDDLTTALGHRFATIIDSQAQMHSTMEVYTSMVTAFASLILVTIGSILILIIFLMMRTLVLKRASDFAMLKAIGTHNRSLMLQILITYLLVLTAGGLLGTLLAAVALNPMIHALFTSLGIMKLNFPIEPWMPLSILLLILLVAILITLAIGYAQRKHTPVEAFRQHAQ